MAVNVPLPVGNYGKADWKDFDNNWRELDAEWLQDRAIMRFLTTSARNTAYPTPVGNGQVVYNDETGNLELYKGGAWTQYRALPTFMNVAANDATQVVLEHVTGGAGKGLTFKPAGLLTGGPLTVGGALTVLTNALIADATGLSIKVGTKVAKLTTDTTFLISDTSISAPSIKLTGTGTVVDAGTAAIVGGSITVTSGQVNGNLGVTGNVTGTFTGPINSPVAGSTIGGVSFPGTTGSGYTNAPSGYVSQAGYFMGNANGAFMRHRNASTGAVEAVYMYVDAANFLAQGVAGSVFDLRDASLRLFDTKPIQFLNTADGHIGYIGPVISSATTPTVASYPEGTIWITP